MKSIREQSEKRPREKVKMEKDAPTLRRGRNGGGGGTEMAGSAELKSEGTSERVRDAARGSGGESERVVLL